MYRNLPSVEVSRLVRSYNRVASTKLCAVTLATTAVLTTCCLLSDQENSVVTNHLTCVIISQQIKRKTYAGFIQCKLRVFLHFWLKHAVDIFEGTDSTWCWSSNLKKDFGSNFGSVTILQPWTSLPNNTTIRPYMWQKGRTAGTTSWCDPAKLRLRWDFGLGDGKSSGTVDWGVLGTALGSKSIRQYRLGRYGELLIGVMETADWGVTGTVVWLSVRQTLDCKGQLLFQLPRCAPH